MKGVPPGHLRDCEPITQIKALGGNDGYDFERSQRRIARQIHIEPDSQPEETR
jgi:hypothetical protein